MKEVKVSIIIPVYNTEKYLKQCIDSAIEQTFENYEIIAVDDESPDESKQILQEYERRYPDKFRLISQRNKGLGGARNTGIREAVGEYVLFLDSDDWIHKDTLSLTYQSAENKKCDMVIFDINCVDEVMDSETILCGYYGQGNILSLEKAPRLLFETPSACNKLYKRKVFIDTGIFFPERVWYEDLRTTIKIYVNTDEIVYLNKPLYFYRQRSNSIMHTKQSMRNLEIIDAVDEVYNYFRGKNILNQFYHELEFMAISHILLEAIPRTLGNSEMTDRLQEYILKRFPCYSNNKYIANLPRRRRIKLLLIERKLYFILQIISGRN